VSAVGPARAAGADAWDGAYEAACVDRLLAVRDQAGLLPAGALSGLRLADAYRVAAQADARRRAGGDVPQGWKIGFTNRSIWPRYGVHQPIWGRVWRSTLTLLAQTEAEVSLAGLVQPRIEPEIVFGFARSPRADMSASDLLACLDWVAHGVEIVHTHLPGWTFGSAAEPVADFGLHGRLLVGPRLALPRPGRSASAHRPEGSSTTGAGDDDARAWASELSRLELDLLMDDRVVDHGVAGVVLDGPFQALQTWLRAMAVDTPDRSVQAGDVVTTGTLTDAWPVAAGQVWRTQPSDPRFPGLRLRFTA
jgi:2-oxo-3-hexenedioate decarboxylase